MGTPGEQPSLSLTVRLSVRSGCPSGAHTKAGPAPKRPPSRRDRPRGPERPSIRNSPQATPRARIAEGFSGVTDAAGPREQPRPTHLRLPPDPGHPEASRPVPPRPQEPPDPLAFAGAGRGATPTPTARTGGARGSPRSAAHARRIDRGRPEI